MVPTMIDGTMPEIIKGCNFGDPRPSYCARYFDQNIIPSPSENMADAVANLVIYLIENSLMKVPK